MKNSWAGWWKYNTVALQELFLLNWGKQAFSLVSISSFLSLKMKNTYILRVHHVPGHVSDMWFISEQNQTQTLTLHCCGNIGIHSFIHPLIHLKIFIEYMLCSRHCSGHVQCLYINEYNILTKKYNKEWSVMLYRRLYNCNSWDDDGVEPR